VVTGSGRREQIRHLIAKKGKTSEGARSGRVEEPSTGRLCRRGEAEERKGVGTLVMTSRNHWERELFDGETERARPELQTQHRTLPR